MTVSTDGKLPARSDPRAALTRQGWSVCALALVGAAALDAARAPRLLLPRGPLWLDAAAAVSLIAALFARPRLRRADWSTPVDGRVLALFALLVLQVVAAGPTGESASWLRHLVACAVFGYALAARLRREPRGPDAVWPAFAIATFLLAGHAIFTAARGLAPLAHDAAAADARWSGHAGLAKALAFATVLSAGRALERGSGALWRAAALVGAIGCGLHAFAGGFGLGARALARLDEPLYFSTLAVMLIVLLALARLAWGLRRERAAEAPRWAAVAIAIAGAAAAGLLGGSTDGEGLRALVTLAGATAIAAHASANVLPAQRPAPPADVALARAA